VESGVAGEGGLARESAKVLLRAKEGRSVLLRTMGEEAEGQMEGVSGCSISGVGTETGNTRTGEEGS